MNETFKVEYLNYLINCENVILSIFETQEETSEEQDDDDDDDDVDDVDEDDDDESTSGYYGLYFYIIFLQDVICLNIDKLFYLIIIISR